MSNIEAIGYDANRARIAAAVIGMYAAGPDECDEAPDPAIVRRLTDAYLAALGLKEPLEEPAVRPWDAATARIVQRLEALEARHASIPDGALCEGWIKKIRYARAPRSNAPEVGQPMFESDRIHLWRDANELAHQEQVCIRCGIIRQIGVKTDSPICSASAGEVAECKKHESDHACVGGVEPPTGHPDEPGAVRNVERLEEEIADKDVTITALRSDVRDLHSNINEIHRARVEGMDIIAALKTELARQKRSRDGWRADAELANVNVRDRKEEIAALKAEKALMIQGAHTQDEQHGFDTAQNLADWLELYAVLDYDHIEAKDDEHPPDVAVEMVRALRADLTAAREERDEAVNHLKMATAPVEVGGGPLAVMTARAEKAEADLDHAAEERDNARSELNTARERCAVLTKELERLAVYTWTKGATFGEDLDVIRAIAAKAIAADAPEVKPTCERCGGRRFIAAGDNHYNPCPECSPQGMGEMRSRLVKWRCYARDKDAEIAAIKAELAANAALLAKQCDLARVAETRAAKAERKRGSIEKHLTATARDRDGARSDLAIANEQLITTSNRLNDARGELADAADERDKARQALREYEHEVMTGRSVQHDALVAQRDRLVARAVRLEAALALYRSMVLGGERESDTSRATYTFAMEEPS